MLVVVQEFNAEKQTVKLLLPADQSRTSLDGLDKPIHLLSGSVLFK